MLIAKYTNNIDKHSDVNFVVNLNVAFRFDFICPKYNLACKYLHNYCKIWNTGPCFFYKSCSNPNSLLLCLLSSMSELPNEKYICLYVNEWKILRDPISQQLFYESICKQCYSVKYFCEFNWDKKVFVWFTKWLLNKNNIIDAR